MHRAIAALITVALTVPALVISFAPRVQAQSTVPSPGTAEDLSGIESRGVQPASPNISRTTFDPFSISPVGTQDIITRTQPLLDLDNNSQLTIESEQVEPDTLRGDDFRQRDRIQVQVQTTP